MSCVYLIREPNLNLYKIGKANDVSQRMSSIKNSERLIRELECVAIISCDSETEAYSLESKLHEEFKESLHAYEYFSENQRIKERFFEIQNSKEKRIIGDVKKIIRNQRYTESLIEQIVTEIANNEFNLVTVIDLISDIFKGELSYKHEEDVKISIEEFIDSCTKINGLFKAIDEVNYNKFLKRLRKWNGHGEFTDYFKIPIEDTIRLRKEIYYTKTDETIADILVDIVSLYKDSLKIEFSEKTKDGLRSTLKDLYLLEAQYNGAEIALEDIKQRFPQVCEILNIKNDAEWKEELLEIPELKDQTVCKEIEKIKKDNLREIFNEADNICDAFFYRQEITNVFIKNNLKKKNCGFEIYKNFYNFNYFGFSEKRCRKILPEIYKQRVRLSNEKVISYVKKTLNEVSEEKLADFFDCAIEMGESLT